jgi:hypothetical protein
MNNLKLNIQLRLNNEFLNNKKEAGMKATMTFPSFSYSFSFLLRPKEIRLSVPFLIRLMFSR